MLALLVKLEFAQLHFVCEFGLVYRGSLFDVVVGEAFGGFDLDMSVHADFTKFELLTKSFNFAMLAFAVSKSTTDLSSIASL